MYVITKEFTFSASHQLRGLSDGHPCARLHGHNYLVKVELARRYLDGAGMVVDFTELDSAKRYIDAKLDHRHLNLVVAQPTAEALARHLFDVFKRDREWGLWLVAVHVSETPKTWAVYRKDQQGCGCSYVVAA